jgi:predicted nucleic acid-binding protein
VSVLVDTNILARIAEIAHPSSAIAALAVRSLLLRGDALHVVPQNFYEFWVVATRPLANNGLGMTATQARDKLDHLTSALVPLPDTPEVLPEWRKLVIDYDCRGKTAHDARLVAAMHVHRLDRILTFNGRDFTRFAGIAIIEPQTVAAPTP